MKKKLPSSKVELPASFTIIVQLSFNNNSLAQLRPRFYIYYKFSCTQKFDSYRVQAEICRNPTSTLQKACSYTCAEVLIGHTWLPHLSEVRRQPCTHLYIPNLQSNNTETRRGCARELWKLPPTIGRQLISEVVTTRRFSQGKIPRFARTTQSNPISWKMERKKTSIFEAIVSST